MNSKTIIRQQNGLTEITEPTPLEIMGQVANEYAKLEVFADYLSVQSDNTLRTHAAALALFERYLNQTEVLFVSDLQTEPKSWRGVTWGIVKKFVGWMLSEGYSIATVNNRLSTIKTYAELASSAGVIDPNDMSLIKTVRGYSDKEAKRIDERRAKTRKRVVSYEYDGETVTRKGTKKAAHVSLSLEQASILKTRHKNTPQGKRDAVLMHLLLDHGLRVGEAVILEVSNFDMEHGEMGFYRPKVNKFQTHNLTRSTIEALNDYLPLVQEGRLLLGSTKGGELNGSPINERLATGRVKYLGRILLGIKNLSAHDCRHYWATAAAREGTDPFSLQEAGGWSSLAMPRLYIENAKIANSGVRLPT